MKKTLIALAAVAVTGAASAQVTLSGEAGFAYVSDVVGSTNVSTSGFSQTDGSISISASEDLGGGMKLVAKHTMDLKGRTGGVSEEDSSLTVMGAFGTVTLGAVEAGNGILGLGGAGGVGRGLDDGTALDGGTNVDLFKYTTPALIPGLTANVARAEVGAAAGRSSVNTTGYGVNYSAGPLAVAFDVTGYNYDAADANTLTDSRTRLSASYDLGVAKIGAGYQKKAMQLTGGNDNKQTVYGVSVPVGAFTLSLAMSSNKTDGSAKVKASDIGVNYALSKRTAVNFSHMSRKADGAASDTFTRLRLKTTF